MNFIKAIQHATIGYGIRRKLWRENHLCLLLLNHRGELEWISGNAGGMARLIPEKIDLAVDITAEDIRACDWEAV